MENDLNGSMHVVASRMAAVLCWAIGNQNNGLDAIIRERLRLEGKEKGMFCSGVWFIDIG